MNMKKKKMAIVTCVVTGTCILAGSAFASYATSNGYDVYKKALKKLVGMENYTLNTVVSVSVDGQELYKTLMTEKSDAGSDVSMSRTESSWEMGVPAGERKFISQNSKNYTYYGANEEDSWTELEFGRGGVLTIDEDDKETASKVMRFTELLADAVVGDLKNNFVYVSEAADGGAKYTITLDSIQMPELINAGLSALCSLNSSNSSKYADDLEYTDPDYFIYHESVVKSASCDFEVDGEGRLVNNVITVELESSDVTDGNHVWTFKGEINMSDYGTTIPDSLPENAKIRNIKSLSETAEHTVVTKD